MLFSTMSNKVYQLDQRLPLDNAQLVRPKQQYQSQFIQSKFNRKTIWKIWITWAIRKIDIEVNGTA